MLTLIPLVEQRGAASRALPRRTRAPRAAGVGAAAREGVGDRSNACPAPKRYAKRARLARIYRWYAPIYDRLFAGMYQSARIRSITSLKLTVRDRILIAGVGTGLDLPELPPAAVAVGFDASPAMLRRAQAANRVAAVDLLLGDAQCAPFANAAFDVAILHLILSVVADPSAAFCEVMRVVRPGGRIAVLDKFAPDNGASRTRCAVNAFVRWSGTDITRRLADIIDGQPVRVVSHETALGRNYQLVLLERREAACRWSVCQRQISFRL